MDVIISFVQMEMYMDLPKSFFVLDLPHPTVETSRIPSVSQASSATAEQLREHELMLEPALFREYPEPIRIRWRWWWIW